MLNSHQLLQSLERIPKKQPTNQSQPTNPIKHTIAMAEKYTETMYSGLPQLYESYPFIAPEKYAGKLKGKVVSLFLFKQQPNNMF
jgi:hypothetical protein